MSLRSGISEFEGRAVEDILRELEVNHPVKGFKPGEIQIGYLPGPTGNAWIANKVIMLPTWTETTADNEYAIIHEYCHFLREVNEPRPKWHRILPFAIYRCHDKKFKQLEDRILTEYHMGIKRGGGIYAKSIYRNGRQETFFWKKAWYVWALAAVSWLVYPLVVILALYAPRIMLQVAIGGIVAFLFFFEYGLIIWSFFRARKIVKAQGRKWVMEGT